MTGRIILTATAVGLSLAAAAVGAPRKVPPTAAPAAPDSSVKQLLQNCDAHKFETVVKAVVDGEPHQSKVKLCGTEGQSDAEWIGTLKDAIAKLKANKDMPASVRDQIVTAITAEIARLQIEPTAKPTEQTAAMLPPPRSQPLTAQPLADEYASLPPLPTAPPPPPHVIGPGAMQSIGASASAKTGRPAEHFEEPLPLAAGPAPKLNFTCYSPGDLADDAPCTGFDRETTLTIRAGENIPAGVSLLFFRNGARRATVELARMQRGKALIVPLPREVCQGVSDGSLQLQLVQNGALLKSDGPYSLRC